MRLLGEPFVTVRRSGKIPWARQLTVPINQICISEALFDAMPRRLCLSSAWLFFWCFLVHQANALAVVHQRATSPLWSKTSSIPSRVAALAPGLSPHPASRLPPSWTFFGPRTLFPPSKRPPRLSSMPSAHSSRLRLSCSRPKSKMSTRSTRIPRRPKWLCNLLTTSKKSKC
jgi:hypothetical protein